MTTAKKTAAKKAPAKKSASKSASSKPAKKAESTAAKKSAPAKKETESVSEEELAAQHANLIGHSVAEGEGSGKDGAVLPVDKSGLTSIPGEVHNPAFYDAPN